MLIAEVNNNSDKVNTRLMMKTEKNYINLSNFK